MKTAILTNKNGKVIWTEGLLTFENLTTGATVCFSGSTEFTLFIGEGEGIRALPSQAFNLSSVECENRAIRLIYTLSRLTVTVVYESTEETFVKTVNVEGKDEINLKRIVLEGREVNYSTSVGGEGMPVFIGNEMWCGIEFPAANNRYF